MKKSKSKISDYSTYNYKKEFWTEERGYEDFCEKNALSYLLEKIPRPQKNVLDAGCGFGRLYPCYKDISSNIILLDYAQNLLDEAKGKLTNKPIPSFVKGDLYNLPMEDNQITTLITIRTLHHLGNLDRLFKEFKRVIKPGGYLIFEIPNKRHLINIIKYVTRQTKHNPFSHKPLTYTETFQNYHPKAVLNLIKKNGFVIEETISSNFFRHRIFKKIIPPIILHKIESILQRTIKAPWVTPSLICLCQREPDL